MFLTSYNSIGALGRDPRGHRPPAAMDLQGNAIARSHGRIEARARLDRSSFEFETFGPPAPREIPRGYPVGRVSSVAIGSSPVRVQVDEDGHRQNTAGSRWLPEALQSLDECTDEALEEGFEPPNEDTMALARRLLTTLATETRQSPDIQPLRGGDVAVDYRNPNVEGGVMFVVEPNGAGICYYRANGTRNRVRTSDAREILEAGGRYALAKVGIE